MRIDPDATDSVYLLRKEIRRLQGVIKALLESLRERG